MDDFQKQFQGFMSDLDKRLENIGVTLGEHLIDHVCFRVTNLSEFSDYKVRFQKISRLFTERQFNGRLFSIFFLKIPLLYKNTNVWVVEFSEPGGVFQYKLGFQHAEILTKQDLIDLSTKKEQAEKIYTKNEKDEFSDLIWPDKIFFKTTNTSILVKTFSENNSSIFINQ